MITIRPREYFAISRQIGDHLDSGTYFVRAVIRNARTDVLIDTVNLTDRGDRRFSAEWQAPGDPSGAGFYISIATSVYTDAGYTTKSPNYADDMNVYLVDERKVAYGGGGGGGFSITPKELRKIVQEEVKKEIGKIKIPKLDFGKVYERIDDIEMRILSLPEPERVDLSPIVARLKEILKSVKNIPKPEKIDFGPVIKSNNQNMAEIEREMSKMFGENIDRAGRLMNMIVSEFGEIKKVWLDKTPALKLVMPQAKKEEDIKKIEKPVEQVNRAKRLI